jgi:hypothetical protein
MFSRPVKSGWNPAPSSSSEPTEPATSSVPVVGLKMPAISRRKVVLPEPFRPTNPTDSPGWISRETSRSAQISVGFMLWRRTIASFSVTFRCG